MASVNRASKQPYEGRGFPYDVSNDVIDIKTINYHQYQCKVQVDGVLG